MPKKKSGKRQRVWEGSKKTGGGEETRVKTKCHHPSVKTATCQAALGMKLCLDAAHLQMLMIVAMQLPVIKKKS